MLKTRVLLKLRFKAANKRISKARYKALYRLLGLIRVTASRSMRSRPGPSRPGAPPHSHKRPGLKLINFTVDRAQEAGLVGPMKFSASNFFNEPVPHIQEFGGTFFHLRKLYNYPERSYMGWTIKKLQREGKILRTFSVSLGTEL